MGSISVVHWIVALFAIALAFTPLFVAFRRKSLYTLTAVLLNTIALLWMAFFPHVLIIPVMMWFAALVFAFRS